MSLSLCGGARFRNDSSLERYDLGLLQWTMLNGEGDEAVKVASYALFGADGRLAQATGFFEAKQDRLAD